MTELTTWIQYKKISLVNEVIKLTNERLVLAPDFQILRSMKTQLDFILDSFQKNKKPTGAEKERVSKNIDPYVFQKCSLYTVDPGCQPTASIWTRQVEALMGERHAE